jgi:tetratricopeptide (TPR) repeat protein
VVRYRHALLLKPDLLLAHTELATALRLQRRCDEAEQSCRRALHIDPEFAPAFVVLAELRADAGRFVEAEELFCRATSLDPASPEAWAGLTRVRRMTPADGAWLATMQRLVQQRMTPQRELLVRYAIGKHCDDVGDFEAAFRNVWRANELAKQCRPPHERDSLSSAVDLVIR